MQRNNTGTYITMGDVNSNPQVYRFITANDRYRGHEQSFEKIHVC